MINLTLATTASKKNVLVRAAETPAEVLENNNVATSGATISLNMRVLSASDFGKTFADLGVADESEAMLSAVVKADSAR